MQNYRRPRIRHTTAGPAAVAVGLLALALACLAMPTETLAANSRSGSRSIYWGAQIGTQLTGTQAPWDMTAVSKFERKVRKRLSLVGFASPFAYCGTPCSFYSFPAVAMENVREHGAIPFFSWGSQSVPVSLSKPNEPNFQLSDLIAGTYDSYIRSFAAAAKSWGHPFFLRFDHEMNGWWFPWSEGVNGNGRGQFVAAWRHVHDIFAAVGATNATWVWCPNVNIRGTQSLRSLYPGDAYVDWTCLDGFNWGRRPGSPLWQRFGQTFHRTYRQVVRRIAPSKPMIIGEIGSSGRPRAKAAWIRNMLATIAHGYRKVHGFLWFDVNDGNHHWPIETSRAATRAFRKGIRRHVYASNAYAELSRAPITPPR